MPVIKTTPHGKLYTRAESNNIWLRFKGEDGSDLRKSAETTDIAEAEAILEREVKLQGELTFRQAAVDFFEVKKRTLKSGTMYRYQQNLRMVDPFFGNKRLSEINREELKKFTAARRRKVSDTTVKRELAFLSTVMSHAVDSIPGGPEANPVLAFSKKALKERPRTRWLTPAEYQRLLDACWEDMHQHIITVACFTGMRHGELLALRKHMVDLDNREVILPGTMTKNGKPRSIPLAGPGFRTVKLLCETAPGDLVFWHRKTRNAASGTPSPFTSFAGFFGKARRRANLNDVRFHDLRHTFASWWVQRGGDLYPLKEILGHGTLDMVQRYAYLDTASAHRAVQDLFSGTESSHSSCTEEEIASHSTK